MLLIGCAGVEFEIVLKFSPLFHSLTQVVSCLDFSWSTGQLHKAV